MPQALTVACPQGRTIELTCQARLADNSLVTPDEVTWTLLSDNVAIAPAANVACVTATGFPRTVGTVQCQMTHLGLSFIEIVSIYITRPV